jgi:hypothetical protein
MNSVERKYFSRFGLINTNMLVNSGFLLERERERDVQAYIVYPYVVYTRVLARVLTPTKTSHLNPIPRLSFLSD